jgi:mannitol/fructose-specific phosphotransferase system IIA component (Ntr-type)
MAVGRRKSWRELCIAALDARDPDELLQILQELNRVLKDEEQVRHDFRHAIRTVGSYEDSREHQPT